MTLTGNRDTLRYLTDRQKTNWETNRLKRQRNGSQPIVFWWKNTHVKIPGFEKKIDYVTVYEIENPFTDIHVIGTKWYQLELYVHGQYIITLFRVKWFQIPMNNFCTKVFDKEL